METGKPRLSGNRKKFYAQPAAATSTSSKSRRIQSRREHARRAAGVVTPSPKSLASDGAPRNSLVAIGITGLSLERDEITRNTVEEIVMGMPECSDGRVGGCGEKTQDSA